MKREEAFNQIHMQAAAFAARFLDPAKDGRSYICPKCGSGSGAKGTGMTLTESGDHAGRFKCWACDMHGDPVDLWQFMHGTEPEEALQEVCAALGIMLDEAPKKKPEEMTEEEKAAELARRIGGDIRAAQLNTADPAYIEYLNRRGIPLDLAKRFKLGFLPLWQHPKLTFEGKKPPASPRLIIPTGKASYIARDTRANLTEAEKQYCKQKAGAASLFNIEALNADRPFFICEGEIDALSFMAAGAEAIGIGGIGGIDELARAIESRKEKHLEPLIIALDNDQKGQGATAKLTAELDKLKIRYYIRNPYGDHKDANEALTADREAFEAAVRAAEAAEFEELTNLAMLAEIKATNDNPPPLIATGFPQLDTLLGGGIKGDELVFFGGVSSSGKSAFCLQVIDQIAKQGGKVLIFSAEMSRKSIMNRSLSRETAEGDGWQYTAAEVGGYSVEKNAKYQEAMAGAYERYAQYAGNIITFDTAEGSASMKPHAIEAKIKRYLNVNRGQKPLVFVDYLQILPAESDKADIRANINRAIEIFAGIAHGLAVPIIMISSLSRENYTMPLNLSAYKESGNIEYGADIVLGLQFERIHDKPFTLQDKGNMAEKWAAIWEEKHRTPRKVEVSLIKRRDGKGEGAVLFDYDARHNLFKQNQADEDFLTANYGDDEEGKKRARARLTGHAYSPDDVPQEFILNLNRGRKGKQ